MQETRNPAEAGRAITDIFARPFRIASLALSPRAAELALTALSRNIRGRGIKSRQPPRRRGDSWAMIAARRARRKAERQRRRYGRLGRYWNG